MPNKIAAQHEFTRSYERLPRGCATLHLWTLIPAFLRRQRNQRRLTLEMLSAKVGPVGANSAAAFVGD